MLRAHRLRDVPRCFFKQKEGILLSGFKQREAEYGKDNLKQAVALIDWYVGTVYPRVMKQPHEEMSRGKVVTFAVKLLNFMLETGIDWDLMEYVLIQTSSSGQAPTIYLVTSPRVLGYHLIAHPEIGWESVANTIYQPVDEFY